MKNHNKSNKAFYKRWWFWAIIIAAIIVFGNSVNNDNGVNDNADDVSLNEPIDKDVFNEISFVPVGVHNDTTGKWKVSIIAEQIDMRDFALAYYNKFFENDTQVHAIVNFLRDTTTRISVAGNVLDVAVYEYVEGEEHDANKLFSGMLLREYYIDKTNGDIQEIW